MNVEHFLNHFAEKVIVCSKGLKRSPSNTLKLFLQNVKKKFAIFMINLFDTNSRFSSPKKASDKKERNFEPKCFQIAAFQQSFAQC